MTPRSRSQVTRLLHAWRAGGVEHFDLGVLNHTSGRMQLRGPWTLDQVTRASGWIAARNSGWNGVDSHRESGASVYARPARALRAHPWILVDDLDEAALSALDELAPVGAVVESSPGSIQAWVRIYPSQDDPTRTALARYLAEQVGGNTGAVGGSQFGRLPGTTNRKPGRELASGQFPFAKLLRTAPQACTPFDRLAPELGPIERPAERTATAPADQRAPPGRSQSDRDFAIACRLAELERTDGEIAAAIRAVRTDSKAMCADYLERTIGAARQRVAGP